MILRLRTTRLALGVGVWLALTGCTYIGQNALNAQLCLVDADGDGDPELACNDEGVAAGVSDCNDNDPNIHSAAEEIPYDGVDQNCDGEEVVDVDGDGYPALTSEEFAALGGEADWPSDVADERDCDDNDPNAYPGASDVYYDGIDHDCAGDDDYDADGDGWVPSAYAQEYDGDLRIGDCNDSRSDINPDVPASEDEWYDGHDSDCAGNNDFDKDGDSWMPDNPYTELSEAEWQGWFHEYESFYGYDFPDQWGDCREDSDPNLKGAGLTPADVYPGAPETWYDAVDADCLGDNDFDQDGDGYMPDEKTHTLAYDQFTTYWGNLFIDEWGDCEDTLPDVHPLAMEHIGDELDHDCDGGNDTTPFSFGSYAWVSPRQIVLGELDSHFALITTADEIHIGKALALIDVGHVLEFDKSSGYQANPTGTNTWLGEATTQDFGTGLHAAFGPDRFYASTSYFTGTNTSFIIREAIWDAKEATYDRLSAMSNISGAEIDYVDIDVRLDADGDAWAIACTTNEVHFLVGTLDSGSFEVEAAVSSAALPSGDVCFIEPPDKGTVALGTTCNASGCMTAEFDASTESFAPAASQPYAGWATNGVHTRGDWMMRIEPTGGISVLDGTDEYLVLDTHDVTDADITWHEGVLYVAAVVPDVSGDGIRDALLAYGDPAVETLIEVPMPLTDDLTESWAVSDVALVTGEERIAFAASGQSQTGGTDAIGWVFMGW